MHDKAANDAKRNKQRTALAKPIKAYAKLYGPDPNMNRLLASAIAVAKRNNVPKHVIENALASAQRKSSAGVALENVIFEIIVAPSVAIIAEVETDNKQRAMQDINQIIKKVGATTGASKFFFTRTGKVVFGQGDKEVEIDQIMDDAIENGAEDLKKDQDGNIVVLTRPSQTMATAKSIGTKFDLKLLSSEIVWSANEDTKVRVNAGSDSRLIASLLAQLNDYAETDAVYSNIIRGEDLSDEEWESMEENLST